MSKRRIQIGIVWANPYNKNLGVGALAYSALAILNDITKDIGWEVDFFFVGSSHSNTDSVTINNQNIKFGNVIGMDYTKWKAIPKLLLLTKKFRLNKILQFDYIFDIAEGDSFTDIYGQERFERILSSKKFFARFKKTQVLLPQTIGPFKDPANEKAAFEVMNGLAMVISRDHQSFNYTKRFLTNNKIQEAIDVAFYMPFVQNNLNNGKINVGINVSGLLWNGGYTKNNQFGMKTDYKKLIRDTIEFFRNQSNVLVHLVPHVVPLDHAVEDDYSVSEELAREYQNVIVSPRFTTPIDAKSYISGLDFFTGARMHACIAAYSTGVPVYPMAYSRKFNGLFGETLEYSWMGDCVNDNETKVLEGLKKAFESRQAIGQQISDSHKKIIQPRIKLLKEIITNILLANNAK